MWNLCFATTYYYCHLECMELSWADQVNYTVQKAWRALHFVMFTVKKGNKKNEKFS